MKSPFVKYAVLLFLSLWQNSDAKIWFGGNNNNNKRVESHPRRRLTDVAQEVVDVDAATGTVKLEDPMSRCDGQLAQALVTANDAEFQAKQERDDALKGKAAALEQIRELQLTVQNLQATVSQLEDKTKMALQEKETAVQAAVQKETTDLQELVQTKDEMIATLQSKIEATKSDVQKEIEAQLAQTNADAQAKEVELHAQLDQQRIAAEELLETTREEAKRVLLEHVGAIKDQLKEFEIKSNSELAEKDATIKQMKVQNERFSKINEEMMQTNRAYAMELDQWRATFEKRGYCNLTYIGEDIEEIAMNAYSQASHAASVATSKASEAALVAASQLNIHGRNLAKELVVHAQLGYEKSKQIYNDQYKVLWPKVKPHYDQHLAPLVNKAAEWRSKEIDPKLQLVKKEYLIMKTKQIDPRIKILKMESKKLFAKMVELYGTHCRATYKVAHQLAKDHDFMEHFQKVGPLVKESCDNAESSVTMLLRAMLILILLPFLGRIFGLLWAIMRLIVNIFLTVTLLRFILPRGTTSKNSVKEQPVPYKTKSNGSPKKRSQRRQ